MPLASTVLGAIPSTADLVELLPAGIILPYGTDPGSAPAGFVFCRGQLESKATYPNLNAVIGDGPGFGNAGYHAYNNNVDPGSGNMRMPNLQNASPLGAGTTSGTARSGAGGAVVAGARPHSHSVNSYALASHSHGAGTFIVAGHGHGDTFSMGNHDHGLDNVTKNIYDNSDSILYVCHYSATEGGANTLSVSGGVSNAGTLSVSGSTASAAATAATGTSATGDMPYQVINFIIKT